MAGSPVRRARGGVPAPGARGYTRTHEPFGEENFEALKHGAGSPRIVRPIAEGFAGELPVIAPWTARPTFAGARDSWAWVEAQLLLVRAYLDANGTLDGDGVPRPAVALLDKLERRAATLRGELGLTPQALARLLASLTAVATAGGDADELAALKAEGREILAARELRAVGEGSGE